MSYFTHDFIQFLKDLSNNNNRDWFNENKKRFENSVKLPFENFIQEMIHRIHEDDEEINLTTKDAVFRIYKDARFSKDKLPYKTYASAVISPGGRKDFTTPGIYLEFKAEEIRFYGGAHFLDKDQVQNIRRSISDNMDGFKLLIEDKEFKKLFGKIHGEQNKRIPQELQEAVKTQPLIANKQFYYYAILGAEKLTSKNLAETLMKYYFAGKPLHQFLKSAMLG
ncbi:MAG: DUF2461 domain-containing protein [Bacteroidetes bacterium]|nr:DUF2461 domain-containing protein [Bacteroidota bacterium]MBU1678803.1 DUF2461 domain-containing protein [Bacteroidota bacterium]MBU2507364.1 DUF2461 domain-containing protein [Bacteroidota bacterium]